MKSDLSGVKKGDAIWQKHVIISVQNNETYPVKTNHTSFTLDGRQYTHDEPSAFLSNPFEDEFVERVMEVSNDGINWYERTCLGKFDNFWICSLDRKSGLCAWKHAREVQPKEEVFVEMTVPEIEAALGKRIKIKG